MFCSGGFRRSAIARLRASVVWDSCSFTPFVMIMFLSPLSSRPHFSHLSHCRSFSLSPPGFLLLLLRGGSPSSIEAGRVLQSRRVSFLHSGGCLPSIEAGMGFSVFAAVTLRCSVASAAEAMQCSKSDLLRSVLRHAVERAFPCAHVYRKAGLLVESHASSRHAFLSAPLEKALAVQSGKGERLTGQAAACVR